MFISVRPLFSILSPHFIPSSFDTRRSGESCLLLRSFLFGSASFNLEVEGANAHHKKGNIQNEGEEEVAGSDAQVRQKGRRQFHLDRETLAARMSCIKR